MSKTWVWIIVGVIAFLVVLNLEVDWSPIYPFGSPVWIAAFYAGILIVCWFLYKKLTHVAERAVFLFFLVFLGISLFRSALKSLGYWIPTGGWGGGNLLDAFGVDLPEGRWVFLAIYIGGLAAGIVAIRSAKGWGKAGLILLTVVFGLSLGPTALEVLHNRFPYWTTSSRSIFVSSPCPHNSTPFYVSLDASKARDDVNPGGGCFNYFAVTDGAIQWLDGAGKPVTFRSYGRDITVIHPGEHLDEIVDKDLVTLVKQTPTATVKNVLCPTRKHLEWKCL